MNVYSWMKSSNDENAVLITNFSNALTPTLATLLGVSSADRQRLDDGARFFSYLQLSLIPAVRDFSKSVTQTRDLFEIDKTPEPLTVPIPNFPPPMVFPSGTVLQSDFFGWLDGLVKRIKLSENYTEQIGLTLGITGTAPVVAKVLKITGHDEFSGGVVHVRVSRAYPMTILEVGTDGGPFVQKAMLPVSEFVFSVPAGMPHVLQVRAQGAERDGTPVGNYTDVLTISTQP